MSLRAAILGFLAIVILAAVGGAWWLYKSRDALIKRALEHYGPQLTGVPVTVKAVNLEPFDGRRAITGLDLGNPQGLSPPHAGTPREARRAPRPPPRPPVA